LVELVFCRGEIFGFFRFEFGSPIAPFSRPLFGCEDSRQFSTYIIDFARIFLPSS
jgi:hypothetical protein